MVRFDISAEQLRPELLRDALIGRVEGVPPSAALALISQGALSGTDRVRAVREIVEDTRVEPLLRAGAVRAFPLADVEAARQALSAFLGSDVDRVVAEAAGVLGQIGTPQDLPALRRARAGTDSAFARRRIAFGEALIVHRFGITDPDAADPEAGLPEVETVTETPRADEVIPFRSTPPGVERRRVALEAVAGEFVGIAATRQEVVEVQCGPRLMEVILDRDVLQDAGRSLVRGPAMPAVVATQDPEDGRFSPAWVVLTRPVGAGLVRALLVRLGNGEPIYVAEGALDRDELVFELRTANVPGVTPVTGQIRLTAARVEITGIAALRARPARTPTGE